MVVDASAAKAEIDHCRAEQTRENQAEDEGHSPPFVRSSPSPGRSGDQRQRRAFKTTAADADFAIRFRRSRKNDTNQHRQDRDRDVCDRPGHDVSPDPGRRAAGNTQVYADDVPDRGGNDKLLHTVLWYIKVSFVEVKAKGVER